MCDALSRNTSPEFATIMAHCLSHGRREFVSVADNFPDECRHVLDALREVYRFDAETKEQKMDPAARLAYHQNLGSSELVDLKIEDIDWQANILHIHRRKTGVAIDLPLLPAVARALSAYLRHGRPPSSTHYVFLSHLIPPAPLSANSITARVVRWATLSKIEAPRINARMLRHTHATRQLEHGVPLKIIGDILGHQDSKTTSRYVRSALNRLRRIALPVPV
jgi:integrase